MKDLKKLRRTEERPTIRSEVHVGANGLEEAGPLLAERFQSCTVAVVTDEIVGTLYYELLRASLERAGFRAVKYVLPCGPAAKRLTKLEGLLEWLTEQRLVRTDVILALGGGSVCDLAGFAAGMYLGGMPYVQMPTTLLAAVDSTVGGQVWLDLEHGGNLLRARCEPRMIFCDTDLLTSLPVREFRSGAAEVIRCGMLSRSGMMEALRVGSYERMEEILLECMAVKADYLAREESERGARKLLDFGRTLGGALLKIAGTALSSGEALGAGMAIVTRGAQRLGLCREDCLTPLMQALYAVHLPAGCTLSAQQLCEAMLTPEDQSNGLKTLVLPQTVGQCVLYPMPLNHLEEFVRVGLQES